MEFKCSFCHKTLKELIENGEKVVVIDICDMNSILTTPSTDSIFVCLSCVDKHLHQLSKFIVEEKI